MLFYSNIIFIYKQANKFKPIIKAIINLYHEYKFEWKIKHEIKKLIFFHRLMSPALLHLQRKNKLL